MDRRIGGSSETHVCAGSTSHLHDILNGFYSKEFAIGPATYQKLLCMYVKHKSLVYELN